jgi:hypothetical protein
MLQQQLEVALPMDKQLKEEVYAAIVSLTQDPTCSLNNHELRPGKVMTTIIKTGLV